MDKKNRLDPEGQVADWIVRCKDNITPLITGASVIFTIALNRVAQGLAPHQGLRVHHRARCVLALLADQGES